MVEARTLITVDACDVIAAVVVFANVYETIRADGVTSAELIDTDVAELNAEDTVEDAAFVLIIVE